MNADFSAESKFYKAVPATLTKSISEVTEADFADPIQRCDVVMKGGITSGIVYPPAILRIGQRFRFMNVGGTSAGAIAAALVAAAEFRRTGQGAGGTGFMQLKTDVLDWLSTGRNLQSLFVPQLPLAPIFYAVFWLISLTSAARRATFIGALNLALSIVLLLAVIYGYLRIFFLVPWPYADIARSVAVVVTCLGIVALIYTSLAMSRSNFGLCSGGVAGTFRGLLHLKVEPLTFWLSRQIDSLAGMPAGRPLTHGDLWAGTVRTSDDELPEPKDRVLNLETITTCLTMGRPFRLPFGKDIFYYRSDELRNYFPDYVVDWMDAHPKPPNPADPASDPRHAYLRSQGYVPLPQAQDLPIVVAARMSLSFPFLIRAIRLYAVDWMKPKNMQNRERPQIEAAWFSDGGLSSNFPVNLFDAALPAWPTLGITLEPFPTDDESEPVVMASNNREMLGASWSPISNSTDFCVAMFNAMQNWRDNLQAEAPGFRDRIAHIRLSSAEGGLNLTMPPSVFRILQERGEDAGAQLVQHFAMPPVPDIVTNWNNHRRIRYFSALAALEPYALQFGGAWNSTAAWNVPPYSAIAAAMTPYPFTVAQAATAKSVTTLMLDISAVVAPLSASLAPGSPRPLTKLYQRLDM